MSYPFAVTVLSWAPEEVEALLQPYHKFEATGTEDQYVVEVDDTDEHRREYESKDPPAYSNHEGVKVSAYEDFRTFLSFMAERPEVLEGFKPDDSTKFGYTLISEGGEVIRTIRRTNPNAKWGRREIGGGSFLLLKDGESANQGRLGGVDFEAMEVRAAKRELEVFDRVASVTNGRTWKTWDEVRGAAESNEKAQDQYWSQDVIAELATASGTLFPEEFDPYRGLTREQCEATARLRGICTFALVNVEGWMARGEMGPLGAVQDPDEWARAYREVLGKAPSDSLITIVDCHI